MKYLVKFTPYNKNTLSGLFFKKIKFSTVFEFNDFNELRFIPPPGKINEEQEHRLLRLLIEFYRTQELKCLFMQQMVENNNVEAFLEKTSTWLMTLSKNTSSLPDEHVSSLLEHLLLSQVGIFCCSSINVFIAV